MAVIVDLESSGNTADHATCDVCVTGAGAAGLFLAGRLSRLGLSVVVLEAGGATCASGQEVGIEPTFSGSPYRGAVEGRAFGLGGSTSRWGGLLVPHSDLDIPEVSDPHYAAWQHIVGVVRERSSAVFAALGLRGEPGFFSYPAKALGDSTRLLREQGFATIAGEFLSFTRRNLGYLASRSGPGSVRIFLHAVACKWSVGAGETGDVSSVEAVSPGARRLRVSAKSFVLAAGTIESTRVLLEIDRSTKHRLLPPSAAIGRYLSDHLSSPIADVHADDLSRVAEVFAPAFANGRMRSVRFVDTLRAPRSPRHFAHFLFDGDSPGFKLARDVLAGIQGRYVPAVTLSNARVAAAGVVGLAYSRFCKSRLFIPQATPTRLQLDVEQQTQAQNSVTLGTEADRYGRPVAVVRWQVSDADRSDIQSLSDGILTRWPSDALGGIRLVSPSHRTGALPKPYDAYHPVGTCRMGVDAEATVDFDLRVRGTRNLFLLSTAVFPSAGTANPTFSMLCLGDQMADLLASTARQGPLVRGHRVV